ncbi:Protein Smg [Vibrio stylophorae]|uniref:Protein Smg homolog n=1 Tax=Vibrio stylophorae TaxID=659351 RepID=A0ABN8DPN6_9VIBR|nr:DUF494 family protein [Vibrio stylophorae]CAH0532278.1 Protein Smg [Vibrio stylophorae]
MMDILMYLFEAYIHSDVELLVDQDELADELSEAGFHHNDILKALAWLEKLGALQDAEQQPMLAQTAQRAQRIYTEQECYRMDSECRGFLMFLEQIQVLDPETRELVIERVMELETNEFNLDDLKWIILLVLFNMPGKEGAYQEMEDLLYEEPEEWLH